ncbi:MAG: hypothetical protein JXR56_02810 [Candidatus Cloacimonetes bacterium]|nr:hypothetical protein [Candidatus Cloacimonadota bacterium]
MPEQNKLDDIHKYFASNLFNQTWELLDNPKRTEEEDFLMIHKAHASLYHWTQVGTPEQVYIGEWQVSRVYSMLKMGESALKHAKRSLTICVENSFTGFNLAYAYESLARAYAVKGELGDKDSYLDEAIAESNNITDKESRQMLLDDLKTI